MISIVLSCCGLNVDMELNVSLNDPGTKLATSFIIVKDIACGNVILAVMTVICN